MMRYWLQRTSYVWKTALASGIAWQLAAWTGTVRPYFAPLAAILCLQVTVEESVLRGYQRMVGIVGGIVIAALAGRLFGAQGWSIALLVFLGTAGAMWLKLGEQAVPQVGVSAIMVLTIGSDRGPYMMDRIEDTFIGVAVAVFINVFVVPPDFTDDADAAVADATLRLAGRFRALADWLSSGAELDEGKALQMETRAYLEDVHAARKRVERAWRALHYSPLVRRRRHKLQHCRERMTAIRQGYAHATGLVRTLLDWREREILPDAVRTAWSRTFADIAGWLSQEEASQFRRESSPLGTLIYPMALANDVLQLQLDFHAVRNQAISEGMVE